MSGRVVVPFEKSWAKIVSAGPSVREQDPKAPDTEIARQKAATRAKAEKDTAFASCPSEVSVKGARCAMSAVNVDEFEKCLE